MQERAHQLLERYLQRYDRMKRAKENLVTAELALETGVTPTAGGGVAMRRAATQFKKDSALRADTFQDVQEYAELQGLSAEEQKEVLRELAAEEGQQEEVLSDTAKEILTKALPAGLAGLGGGGVIAASLLSHPMGRQLVHKIAGTALQALCSGETIFGQYPKLAEEKAKLREELEDIQDRKVSAQQDLDRMIRIAEKNQERAEKNEAEKQRTLSRLRSKVSGMVRRDQDFKTKAWAVFRSELELTENKSNIPSKTNPSLQVLIETMEQVGYFGTTAKDAEERKKMVEQTPPIYIIAEVLQQYEKMKAYIGILTSNDDMVELSLKDTDRLLTMFANSSDQGQVKPFSSEPHGTKWNIPSFKEGRECLFNERKREGVERKPMTMAEKLRAQIQQEKSKNLEQNFSRGISFISGAGTVRKPIRYGEQPQPFIDPFRAKTLARLQKREPPDWLADELRYFTVKKGQSFADERKRLDVQLVEKAKDLANQARENAEQKEKLEREAAEAARRTQELLERQRAQTRNIQKQLEEIQKDTQRQIAEQKAQLKVAVQQQAKEQKAQYEARIQALQEQQQQQQRKAAERVNALKAERVKLKGELDRNQARARELQEEAKQAEEKRSKEVQFYEERVAAQRSHQTETTERDERIKELDERLQSINQETYGDPPVPFTLDRMDHYRSQFKKIKEHLRRLEEGDNEAYQIYAEQALELKLDPDDTSPGGAQDQYMEFKHEELDKLLEFIHYEELSQELRALREEKKAPSPDYMDDDD